MSSTAPVPDALLQEAADWAMAIRFGESSAQERAAFERWRQSSPAHGQAWQRAEAVFGTFERLPRDIAAPALQSLQRNSRRRSLQVLSVLAVVAPAAWLAWRMAPWQAWTADLATATGERKTVTLADGTRLVLNTASAADILFTPQQRLIRLHAGEILVTTHADPAPTHRPFLVATHHGVAEALGTRFSVRRLEEDTRVAVFEHAVELRPLGGSARRLQAGQQADFSMHAVDAITAVDNSATLWEQGMLLARDMRLAAVLAELARYRHGMLRCDPAVADMRVTGAIALDGTDRALDLLAASLPLRVEYLTPYWARVMAR